MVDVQELIVGNWRSKIEAQEKGELEHSEAHYCMQSEIKAFFVCTIQSWK